MKNMCYFCYFLVKILSKLNHYIQFIYLLNDQQCRKIKNHYIYTSVHVYVAHTEAVTVMTCCGSWEFVWSTVNKTFSRNCGSYNFCNISEKIRELLIPVDIKIYICRVKSGIQFTDILASGRSL